MSDPTKKAHLETVRHVAEKGFDALLFDALDEKQRMMRLHEQFQIVKLIRRRWNLERQRLQCHTLELTRASPSLDCSRWTLLSHASHTDAAQL